MAMDEKHDQQRNQDQQLPAPPLPEEAAANAPAVERNEELEVAIRGALQGPDKDLGRLCKTLGENFCLAPPRPKRAVGAEGYDSGSDTTSPADQEHSSTSGSETGGDHAAAVSGGAPSGPSSGKDNGGGGEQDEILQAVAAAARVSREGRTFCHVCVSNPSGARERDGE